jgi:hypothetical protein
MRRQIGDIAVADDLHDDIAVTLNVGSLTLGWAHKSDPSSRGRSVVRDGSRADIANMLGL